MTLLKVPEPSSPLFGPWFAGAYPLPEEEIAPWGYRSEANGN